LHTTRDTLRLGAVAAAVRGVEMEARVAVVARVAAGRAARMVTEAATLVDCSAVAGGRRAGKAAETGCTRRSHGTCHSSMRTSWW